MYILIRKKEVVKYSELMHHNVSHIVIVVTSCGLLPMYAYGSLTEPPNLNPPIFYIGDLEPHHRSQADQ